MITGFIPLLTILIIGIPLSALFVQRMMAIDGTMPSYLKTFGVVCLGFFVTAVIWAFQKLAAGDNSLIKLSYGVLLYAILGYLYKVLLRSQNGKTVGAFKSVLVAFGGMAIAIIPTIILAFAFGF